VVVTVPGDGERKQALAPLGIDPRTQTSFALKRAETASESSELRSSHRQMAIHLESRAPN